MVTAALEIEGLSKRFGRIDVIRNLSLSVPAGEIFGFLGPNGAGKTTTIRLITGILEPTEGRISIDGIDLAVDPMEAKRRTGFLPDMPHLYPNLTGGEFLEFVAGLYGCREALEDGWADELLDRFDLTGRRGDFIASYSHGMKQKLSVIAALLHRPRLIVVDEPLIGLDPPAARSIKDLFLEFVSDGAAVFMSTHLLEIAEAICDRVGIIDEGVLVEEGRLDDLMEARNERLEAVFLRLLAERREAGTIERARWEALAEAARRARG